MMVTHEFGIFYQSTQAGKHIHSASRMFLHSNSCDYILLSEKINGENSGKCFYDIVFSFLKFQDILIKSNSLQNLNSESKKMK